METLTQMKDVKTTLSGDEDRLTIVLRQLQALQEDIEESRKGLIKR